MGQGRTFGSIVEGFRERGKYGSCKDDGLGPTLPHLDNLRLGRWGEYFARMAFVRAGLDVYSPEVDDRANDALIRIPSNPPRYLEVQVKTVRAAKSGYIFMRKRQFYIRPDSFSPSST